jgi:alpha-beta hydrolase superfamily lysophospholipase
VTWRLTRRARAAHPEPIPAAARGHFEELRLDTRDGERLGAWWVPPAGPSEDLRIGTRCTVLLLHGNGGTRTSMEGLARALSDEGLLVLVPTLRAHGDSTGEANDFGWSAREDVVACVQFLEQRAPGVPIVVYGASMGAAAAMYAAGELGARVAGYALEAPYRDLRSATRHRLEIFLPPGLDRIAFAGMVLVSPAILPRGLDHYAPIEHAEDFPSGTRVLFLSGSEDGRTPIAEVEAIRARCVARTGLVPFPGAGHGYLWSADPARFRTVMIDLVHDAVTGSAGVAADRAR